MFKFFNKKDREDYSVAHLIALSNIVNTYKDDDLKIYSEVTKILWEKDKQPEKKVADAVISHFVNILNEVHEFKIRFTWDGVEYGFINLDKLTPAEWIDIAAYTNDAYGNADRLMAIFYRPIINKLGDMYSIEKYGGTDKYVEVMRDVDYRYFMGALVFFWTLGISLSNATHIYTQQQK